MNLLFIFTVDGESIETVIMKYDRKNTTSKGKARSTVCLSSQVGCNMGTSDKFLVINNFQRV